MRIGVGRLNDSLQGDKYSEYRDCTDEDMLDEILNIINDDIGDGNKLNLIRECIAMTGRDAYGNR